MVCADFKEVRAERGINKKSSATTDSSFRTSRLEIFCGYLRMRLTVFYWCQQQRVAHLTQLFYADCRGHDLNRPRQHACYNSRRDPMLLWGQRRRTMRDKWVAAQKPSNSIWQGKPACWGLPEFNFGCPGPVSSWERGNGYGRAHHNDNIPNKHRLEEHVIWDAHEAEAVRGVTLEVVVEDFAHEEEHFRFPVRSRRTHF